MEEKIEKYKYWPKRNHNKAGAKGDMVAEEISTIKKEQSTLYRDKNDVLKASWKPASQSGLAHSEKLLTIYLRRTY